MFKRMKNLSFFRRFLPRAVVGLCGWSLSYATVSQAVVSNVNVGDDFFSPTSTTINAGDQVRWTWIGSIPHSTTSNTGLWDSGVHSGGSFTFSHTFSSAGNFPYFCVIHSFMTASVTVQSVNLPPLVSITAPTNGAVVNAPASFALVATASSSNGTITNVQFFQGSASIGNVAHSPFSLSVSNLAAGNYTFAAVATDNGGLKATNTVSILVNALPTVAIIFPTNGATFVAPWTPKIQATASDSDGTVSSVSVFANAVLLGTMTNPPLNFKLTATNLSAGTYVLTAQAMDNNSGSTTSAGVTVNVVTAPAVSLSALQRLSQTGIQFEYAAKVGLSYVVQRSRDLMNWTAIGTNVAGSASVLFVDTNATTAAGYYRVEVQPNL
jgi:plastocyanin